MSSEIAPEDDELCAEITTLYRDQIGNIIAIGQRLLVAKSRHPKSFVGWAKRMRRAGLLPFGYRQARRYIKVAEHPTLSDVNYSAHLPQSLCTLDQLADVPAETLRRLIDAGDICSDLNIEEAHELAHGRPDRLMHRDTWNDDEPPAFDVKKSSRLWRELTAPVHFKTATAEQVAEAAEPYVWGTPDVLVQIGRELIKLGQKRSPKTSRKAAVHSSPALPN